MSQLLSGKNLPQKISFFFFLFIFFIRSHIWFRKVISLLVNELTIYTFEERPKLLFAKTSEKLFEQGIKLSLMCLNFERDPLHDLVPFVQFKKHETNPCFEECYF